tara:strand:- start:1517 stop:2179 length:663 start_codon:yes stop_codon:yes gene_type:complete
MEVLSIMPNDQTLENVIDLDLTKIKAYDNPDDLPSSKLYTASSVKADKPGKVEWFKVRNDEDAIPGLFITLADAEGLEEKYLVYGSVTFQDHLKKLLPGTFTTRLLVHYKNSIGGNGIWPVSTYKSEKFQNRWTASAMEAVQLAKKRWTKIAANMSEGCYTIWDPGATLAEKFGEVDFDLPYSKVIALAFHGKIITEDTYETFDPLVRAVGGGIIETKTE